MQPNAKRLKAAKNTRGSAFPIWALLLIVFLLTAAWPKAMPPYRFVFGWCCTIGALMLGWTVFRLVEDWLKRRQGQSASAENSMLEKK